MSLKADTDLIQASLRGISGNVVDIFAAWDRIKTELNKPSRFDVWTNTLRKDDDLRRSYHDNIAMAYFDCSSWCQTRDSVKKRHMIGNKAAKYFLDLLLSK